jgi:H+/Cl- antiporter ClcA
VGYVPLGGALEVLLGKFRLSAVIPAVTTSVLAAYVAQIDLGDQTQYVLSHLSTNQSLLTWSFVAGPFFGYAAHWFASAVRSARARAPREWRLLVWCAVVFLLIGLIAIPLPQILGKWEGARSIRFRP